ncbi:outer membrane protein [Sphingomonas alpina]|uniref:Porin family protein n=1 Tax=Sphingomonas alpina TaxID=653931 RepID=A0A7H0LI73_9SPHN|nr:outer membrane beta-barrel protein [Sphingomonas alpina]QNQ09376.1 porin family protein [Sphingomonas alpina]
MRKPVLTAAAGALALGIAAPALAQDGPPEDSAFTGPRIEALVGYDKVNAGSDVGSSDGVAYGGAIGYDAQFGRAIVGVEGEITGSTTDTRTRNLLVAGDRFRLDAGRDLYAGARVGIAISPLALGYVKAGYTNARLSARYQNGNTTIEDSENLDGYRLGAGLEYKVGPTTYIKGEYRYSHYGELAGYDIDADRHQLLAGVGVRF